MPSFPVEIFRHILHLASFIEDEESEQPSSPAYWSWPLRTQEVFWGERLMVARVSWNTSVKLRLVCRAFNDIMTSRLRQSAVLIARSSRFSIFPRTIDASSLNHLKIFTRQGCHLAGIWDLLRANSATIESFFVEMGAAMNEFESRHPLPHLGLESVTFPKLKTFTFRTSAASEWMQVTDLVTLLCSSPRLKHLTIFQLAGPSTDLEALALLESLGEPVSQLESLHIRRVRWIAYEYLRFILAKSHQTLKRLTWVFERPASIALTNPTFDRGVFSKMDLCNALEPCTEIETLRVADFLNDKLPQIFAYRELANAADKDPLSLTLHKMASHMKKLTRLEIAGPIMTPELYDSKREDILCPLKNLVIDHHPQFRLYELIKQLRRNTGPLRQLEHLTIDQNIRGRVLPDEWDSLERICQARGVQLRLHGDSPSANLPQEDVSTLLERLAIKPS